MDEIADFVQKQNMWMHVDGAYGASVALSKSRRSLMRGVSRADSLSWDAHKWLFLTYGCGMVIVRKKHLLLRVLPAMPNISKMLQKRRRTT